MAGSFTIIHSNMDNFQVNTQIKFRKYTGTDNHIPEITYIPAEIDDHSVEVYQSEESTSILPPESQPKIVNGDKTIINSSVKVICAGMGFLQAVSMFTDASRNMKIIIFAGVCITFIYFAVHAKMKQRKARSQEETPPAPTPPVNNQENLSLPPVTNQENLKTTKDKPKDIRFQNEMKARNLIAYHGKSYLNYMDIECFKIKRSNPQMLIISLIVNDNNSHVGSVTVKAKNIASYELLTKILRE